MPGQVRVKGMFTSVGAIVMRGENGQLWAAYTTGDDVRYFTTESKFKNELPLTIKQWAQFPQPKKVNMAPEIEAIPKF